MEEAEEQVEQFFLASGSLATSLQPVDWMRPGSKHHQHHFAISLKGFRFGALHLGFRARDLFVSSFVHLLFRRSFVPCLRKCLIVPIPECLTCIPV